MDKKYISIFKPQRVRKLLKCGFHIYDIKADKENKDKTIFIFENSEELQKELEILIKQGF